MNWTASKKGLAAGFFGTILAYVSSYFFHWPKNENLFAPMVIGILISVVVAFWPQSKSETE